MAKKPTTVLFRVTTGKGQWLGEGYFPTLALAQDYLRERGDGTGRIQAWAVRILSDEGSDCE